MRVLLVLDRSELVLELSQHWRGRVTVQGFGNLRACVGFLLGEAAEELYPATLAAVDPAFPLVAAARRPRAQRP